MLNFSLQETRFISFSLLSPQEFLRACYEAHCAAAAAAGEGDHHAAAGKPRVEDVAGWVQSAYRQLKDEKVNNNGLVFTGEGIVQHVQRVQEALLHFKG